MDKIIKPYLFRASLIAAMVILLGLTLSVSVYIYSENVRNNAIDLVENRLPTLTSINQLIADLNEQERIIYEYYGNQNTARFEQAHQENLNMLAMHKQALAEQELFKTEYTLIMQSQKELESLIQAFHQAMQLEENNWDYLRELLEQLSTKRRELLPVLLDIEEKTKAIVDHAHDTTMAQIDLTHDLVAYFAISIILLGGLVAWYSKQHLLTNAKSQRLALFSTRNPNPIVSVTALGEITFYNPATTDLLNSVGLNEADIELLLPSNFISIREELAKRKNDYMTMDLALKSKLLEVTIHWQKDIDAYDLHMVDITERRLAERRIEDLAYYDQQTHLHNRYKLDDDIDELILNRTSFTFGLIALRHYMRLVSVYDIDTIQSLIVSIAKEIHMYTDGELALYQMNEYQFAVLVTGDNKESRLEQLCEGLLKRFECSIATEYGEFFVELDFGLTGYPEDGKKRIDIIQNANIALNKVELDQHLSIVKYDPEWGEHLASDAYLQTALRKALINEELFLVFQPQLCLADKEITGIETLIRWRHQGEIISPAEFIPLAEQSGLIVPIGKWIMEKACLFAKQLIEEQGKPIVVAVNVSPRQFSHPEFCQMVEQVLQETGLEPQYLELEITEGVFMHNEQQMLSVLHCLKRVGVQLSIDDFGTGYSSLSYLKQFPVDKLKIDQSFIRNSHENEEDQALVKTVISLGKSLGLSLIAEGVEEKAHVDFLQNLECEEIQGYWFSRPLPADELANFIKEQA